MCGLQGTAHDADFEDRGAIGSGSFGKVRRCFWRSRMLEVAVKRSKKMHDPTLVQEVKLYEVMKQSPHKNVVTVYATRTVGERLEVVMEYCPLGSLSQHLKVACLTTHVSEWKTSAFRLFTHWLQQGLLQPHVLRTCSCFASSWPQLLDSWCGW